MLKQILIVRGMICFLGTWAIFGYTQTAPSPLQTVSLTEKLVPINLPRDLVKAAVAPLYPTTFDTSFSGVNDAGIVVGYTAAKVTSTTYDGTGMPPYTTQVVYKSFSYRDGKFAMIPDPVAGWNTKAIAINNHGQVLLEVGAPGQSYFLYDFKTSVLRPVSANVSVSAGGTSALVRLTALTGLNDAGEVVGYVKGGTIAYGAPSLGAPGSKTEGTEASPFKLVSSPCPVLTSGGINNHDDVIGVCLMGKTFVAKSDGTMIALLLPAHTIAYRLDNGLGVNDLGLVVGFSSVNSDRTAFVCKDGQCAKLAPGPPGDQSQWINLRAVNNRGQLVGSIGFRSFAAFSTTYKPE